MLQGRQQAILVKLSYNAIPVESNTLLLIIMYCFYYLTNEVEVDQKWGKMEGGMKKTISIIAVLIGALLMNASNVTVSAESSGIEVVIDGNTQHYNVAPVNSKGSILVPMRAIFETFKATMIWDGRTQQVIATKGTIHIVLTINSPTATINGKEVELNTVPQLVNGSTMIPLRIVGQTFGADVKWISEKNTVEIISTPNEIKMLENQDNKIEEEESSQPSTSAKTDSNTKTDPTSRILTTDELNTLLLAFSQNSESDFNSKQSESLSIALAMDKTQIFELLVGQYNYETPDAQKNRNIEKLFKQYFANELELLTNYSLNNSDSHKTGYAINRIINVMPDEMKFKAMSKVLEEHRNPKVRYNAVYLISKMNSEEAFNELAKVVSSEKDEMVFGNVVAGAIKTGGSNKDKISIMFYKYNDLSNEFKSSFCSMLYAVASENISLKSAWKDFLDEKLSTGSESERNNSEEIINNVI
jgi:hypothetical protein